MELIRKLLRILRQWLLIGEGDTEPDTLLDRENRAIAQEVAESKRKAIAAVGRRNALRRMLRDHRKQAARLDAEARRGLERGATGRARQALDEERDRLEVAMMALRIELERTEKEAEAVRTRLLQVVEAQVRRGTAEHLSQIAGWRQAEIDHAWRQARRGGARREGVPHVDLALVAALILLLAVLVWLASAGP